MKSKFFSFWNTHTFFNKAVMRISEIEISLTLKSRYILISENRVMWLVTLHCVYMFEQSIPSNISIFILFWFRIQSSIRKKILRNFLIRIEKGNSFNFVEIVSDKGRFFVIPLSYVLFQRSSWRSCDMNFFFFRSHEDEKKQYSSKLNIMIYE